MQEPNGPATFIPKNTNDLNLSQVEIDSERLSLRPITLAFAEDIFREFTPQITRYMTPTSASSIDETRAFISEAIEQRERLSDLILVILKRGSLEFLGVCGLHARGTSREPELGLWLAKGAHGHRYGREAIHALRSWAVSTLTLDSFVYPVDRANIPSRKIPESMGGIVVAEKETPTMSGGVLDIVVYRVPA